VLIMATWMMTAAATALVLPWPFSDALAYACYFSIYLPLFIIGRVFYLEHTKQLDSHTALTMVGANACLLCLLYSFRWPGKLMEAPTEPAVTYFMAIILFYIVMRTPITTMPRPIRFFADISYSLYLVHLPAGSFAMAAVSALRAPRPIILIAGLCAAVGAATATSRFVERPCQALGRRLLRNAASLLEGLPCRFLPESQRFH
jgi:exopolysaccharide production protein ExoZ